jgi:hypothetical protein
MRTGSKNIVCNVWSDEAREAAIAARRAAHGKEYADPNALEHMRKAESEEHLDEIHRFLATGHIKGPNGWSYPQPPESEKMIAYKEKMDKQKSETERRQAHLKWRVRRGKFDSKGRRVE